jgi:RNA polymerase sigma factor (sigma-70 family)
MGLLHAMASFNVSGNASLATYAIYHIRHKIQRFVDDNMSDIRVPVYLRERLRKIARAGTEPTTEHEIAARVALRPATRLDASIDDSDGDRTFADVIPSNEVRPDTLVADALDSESWRAIVDKLLRHLTVRERDVVLKRFREEPMTLESIADPEGVTREAIRMREVFALRKLRRHAERLGVKFADLWGSNT